ncbi:MAG TPA: hypothetical protein VHG93_04735 [Longimicrobium sp.]|nr:hypothetical protein [Longimicrobium sp.]
MAGKAGLVNSIVDRVEGTTAVIADDGAAVAADETAERSGGWVADGWPSRQGYEKARAGGSGAGTFSSLDFRGKAPQGGANRDADSGTCGNAERSRCRR